LILKNVFTNWRNTEQQRLAVSCKEEEEGRILNAFNELLKRKNETLILTSRGNNS